MSFAQISVAIALFVLIIFLYRKAKAKWQGMTVISVMLFILGGVPLLLDKFNPLMRATWESDDLFRSDGDASILDGGLYEYCVIFVIAGVLLFILALIKRSKHPARDHELDAETETDSPVVRYLREKLLAKIQETEEAVGDPIPRGEEDGRNGMPHSKDTQPPQGLFEFTTHGDYTMLGSGFVQATVAELKQKIQSAVEKLAQLKDEIDQHPYNGIAEGYYSQNYKYPGVGAIAEIKRSVNEATNEKNKFKAYIRKYHGDVLDYDWPKRTTLTFLICIGLFFAVLEFSGSLYLLEDAQGERAQLLAAIATVVVLILSLSAAFLVQHMRRERGWFVQLVSFSLFLSCLFVVFAGLGLLIGDRQLGSDPTIDTDLYVLLERIRAAYVSLLGNLLDLVLFVINFFAIAFLFYKALHYFEKYHGYDSHNEKEQKALVEYHSLRDVNHDEVNNAVTEANKKSVENISKANKYCDDISDTLATLRNIKPIIASEYANYLNPSFAGKIAQYRRSNERNRSAVQPAPQYFKTGYELRDVSEYFSDCGGIDQFLEENKQKFDGVNATRAAIKEKSVEWDAAVTQFSTGKINASRKHVESVDCQ